VVSANVERVKEMMRLVDELRVDELVDYFAADAVMELPFAPGRMQKRYEGRDAIAEFQGSLRHTFSKLSMHVDAIHETTDPHVVIAEHRSDGVVAENGRPYQNRYVTVFEFDDAGMVVRWCEYYDAGVVVRAFRPS
jgi:ketosteroid isomerase-like protein